MVRLILALLSASGSNTPNALYLSCLKNNAVIQDAPLPPRSNKNSSENLAQSVLFAGLKVAPLRSHTSSHWRIAGPTRNQIYFCCAAIAPRSTLALGHTKENLCSISPA